MAIEVGQKIGDYQVIRPLGAGGLGAVYQVQHTISGRSEALKIMLPGLLDSPELSERFHREIRLLASLNHFNIAGLHNAFYHENQLVMVMEYVEGQTFTSLTRAAPVPVPHAINWISQVLSALTVAHGAGIIHRDIKPGNIMLTGSGVVKLLDFGIAFLEKSPHLTLAGHIVGSPNYMSPEQFTGAPVTPLSDIYSLGITLYELVTRQLPFTGSTTYELMTAHLHKTPPPPAVINPTLPAFLCQAIERSLAKDPAKRFQSADEFKRALNAGANFNLIETVAASYIATQDTGEQPSPTGRPATASQNNGSLPLDQITKHLAVHIGPVAKFIVKKLAATCTSMDDLYAAAAKEIPSMEARNQFLRSRLR